MKKILFLLFVFMDGLSLYAQNNSPLQLEISTQINFDKYTDIYPSPVRSLTMKGTSPGIVIGINFPVTRGIYLKPFVGYYKFQFDNIIYEVPLEILSYARLGSIPNVTVNLSPYLVDKYHYNCINIGLAFEKSVKLQETLQLVLGGQFSNYFTYSQKYHAAEYYLIYGNDNIRKTSFSDYFGSRIDFQVGLTKALQKFGITPRVFVPLFSSWRQDEFFVESNKDFRRKSLKGIGIGLSVAYNLD